MGLCADGVIELEKAETCYCGRLSYCEQPSCASDEFSYVEK